jgi:dipeptidyl aminopeptidase/acylaminoacyl peptidase
MIAQEWVILQTADASRTPGAYAVCAAAHSPSMSARTRTRYATPMSRVVPWLMLAVALLASRAACAQIIDPIHRFQTLHTTHFVILFHDGEAPAARRLAAIAEETWRALRDALDLPPPPLTHVVLVDQSESANGWATPVPRDAITITAAWPAGTDFIGATDDWLRLVLTHELTHIVHLDQSRGWARVVRGIFGRVALAFPNTLTPTWMIEGLATFEESAITGHGRLHAADFRAVVDEAAREQRLEPMDRVNGGLTAWPSGFGPYAYGLGFHAYLTQRFGDAALGRLAVATSRSLPYFWPRAYTRVLGVPVATLWRDYETSLATRAATAESRAQTAAARADEAVRLTHSGFTTTGPRIAAASCATCPAQVVYVTRTPHEFPSLAAVPIDGSAPPARIADRFGGETTAVGQAVIYFDQEERWRNAGQYRDLYALDRRSGRVRALTREARVGDPDLSPDGTRLVAVRSRAGARDLVLLPASGDAPIAREQIAVLASGPDTQFDAPRWSPDGRFVAAERHRPGHFSEIVVVDVATRDVRVVAARAGTRWVTPAWRPDGRAIVAAADVDEHVFNLYEIPIDEAVARPLTHTTGGATWPDVSSDGQTIVFVGYTADGFDIFRAPYRVDAAHAIAIDPALRGAERAFRRAEPSGSAGANASTQPSAAGPEGPALRKAGSTLRRNAVDDSNDVADPASRPYSPWSTLAPTSWTPTIEQSGRASRAGISVTGSDVLGYHVYTASAAWLVSQPAGTPDVSAASPDFGASYAYARWTLQPWIAATRSTSFFGVLPAAGGAPVTATLRERQIETGLLAPRGRVHWSQAARVSYIRTVADIRMPGGTAVVNRSAMRASWAIGTAKTFGYSISPERGVLAGVAAETVRRALGADDDATNVTGDARAYLPGLARHHVVALRLAGGASRGEGNAQRVFLLGGGLPAPAPGSFGSEAFSLLRGLASDSFAGTHVVVANADYRLPLWRPERGIGPLPVFLHTVHASLTADAGQIWTERFSNRDLKYAAGAEISADVVVGYALPLTFTTGAAWGHDGSGLVTDGWRTYVRIGRAF